MNEQRLSRILCCIASLFIGLGLGDAFLSRLTAMSPKWEPQLAANAAVWLLAAMACGVLTIAWKQP